MPQLSPQTLMMAIQAVEAEMDAIVESADGDVTELDRGPQELLVAYERAAMELKACYLEARKAAPGLPPYNELVSGGRSAT